MYAEPHVWWCEWMVNAKIGDKHLKVMFISSTICFQVAIFPRISRFTIMLYIKDKICYAFVWLSRWNKCRGFGVQSPNAYSFVRYVINEHYPYYGYSDLKEQFPDLSWKSRRLYELYFRIANYSQADVWLLNVVNDDCRAQYIKAGCNASQIFSDDKFVNEANVILIDHPIDSSLLYYYLSRISSDAIIIIENIGLNEEMDNLWRMLLVDNRVGRTFDLHYCGIAFFDTTVAKQHYIVNF